MCQAFKRKIFQDQLCYEIDLTEYKQYLSLEVLKKGFSFVVDLNDNRKTSTISSSEDYPDSGEENLGKSPGYNFSQMLIKTWNCTLVNNYVKFEDDENVAVYLGLLGII